MNDEKIITYPRIFVEGDLKNHQTMIELTPEHAHYFKNVLRQQDGNAIRVFNGRDGEWLGTLNNLSKKSGQLVLQECLHQQPQKPNKTALYFAPIKKSRLDILIEKAVELGATDLHPIITDRTENRTLKLPRIKNQIIEASEQCERMDVPTLHPILALKDIPQNTPIYACIERDEQREKAPFISTIKDKDMSFLIGPAGGFTDQEVSNLLKSPNIRPISLGERIYRAETASILCLAHAALLK